MITEIYKQKQIDMQYVIENIADYNIDELLKFDFCKLLITPRYTNTNILVFRNAKFYSLITNKFISTRRKSGKTYSTIFAKNDGEKFTTMIVPYIICYLFRNDYLKHDKHGQNHFEYLDGDYSNCDADNIRANYYKYDIIEYMENGDVVVNICNYEVLLDYEFVLNELHKYSFHVTPYINNVYFTTESYGRPRKLHQIVMDHYYPNEILTGVIDHINHNTLDNRVSNLKHINHIINAMNNLAVTPNWSEERQIWLVRYKKNEHRHSKTFSVYKYGTKEKAYDEAVDFINNEVIPRKKEYLEEKDLNLKIKELDNLIKYFSKNNMLDKIYDILNKNKITVQ